MGQFRGVYLSWNPFYSTDIVVLKNNNNNMIVHYCTIEGISLESSTRSSFSILVKFVLVKVSGSISSGSVATQHVGHVPSCLIDPKIVSVTGCDKSVIFIRPRVVFLTWCYRFLSLSPPLLT